MGLDALMGRGNLLGTCETKDSVWHRSESVRQGHGKGRIEGHWGGQLVPLGVGLGRCCGDWAMVVCGGDEWSAGGGVGGFDGGDGVDVGGMHVGGMHVGGMHVGGMSGMNSRGMYRSGIVSG